MNLFEAFENCAVGEIEEKPDRVIETLISKLYFFGDKVYKVYKWNKAFYGDFSSLDFRRSFYQEDFFWNNAMAPHIYLELSAVRNESGVWKGTEIENADDFYIVMNKIDEGDNLTNRLLRGEVSEGELRQVVRYMTEKLTELTREKKESLKHIVDRGLLDMEEEIMRDLREWCYMADPVYPKAKTDLAIDALTKAIKVEEYFSRFDKSKLSISVDSHSDNVLISSNEVGFLDILPPKDLWRIDDPFYNTCRLAADVAALGNQHLADVMCEEYYKVAGSVPENIRNIYELKSLLIKAPYLVVLKRGEEAAKYFELVDRKLGTLHGSP